MTNKTSNLADTVYFTLKNRILRGELRPGTALREENLSEIFQVSRTPLRKALTQLMVEGYLTKGRDRTLRIPEISPDQLKDTLAARKLLEIASVEEAATKATKEDIGRLEHFIWDEEEAMRTQDNLLVASIDRMFHNYLAQTSGNRIYEEFIGQLGYKVSLYLALSNTLGEVINEALKEHREILNSVKLKMPDRAAKAMKDHLDNVERRMLESIRHEEENSKSPALSSKIKKKSKTR